MRIFTGIAVRSLAVGTVVLMLATACGDGPSFGLDDELTQQAHRAALAKGESIADGLRGLVMSKADDFAHAAGQQADVMKVDGTSKYDGDGVVLILRVTGQAVQPAPAASNKDPEEVVPLISPMTKTVTICVRVVVDRSADAFRGEVECPTTEPLAIPKDPKLPPGIEESLRTALSAAGSDEAAARKAVDGLVLPEGIRRDVAAAGGVVGVALRASQYDCVLGRFIGGAVQVWRPSRVQLAPGELGCTAQTAVAGSGQTPPH